MQARGVQFFLLGLFSLHAVLAALGPNQNSIPHKALDPFLGAYIIQTGLSSTWSFKGDLTTRRNQIDYRAVSASSSFAVSENDFQRWPPDRPQELLPFLWHIQNAAATNFFGQEEFVVAYFVPWVCRKNPDRSAVLVRVRQRTAFDGFVPRQEAENTLIGPKVYPCPSY